MSDKFADFTLEQDEGVLASARREVRFWVKKYGRDDEDRAMLTEALALDQGAGLGESRLALPASFVSAGKGARPKGSETHRTAPR